MSARSPARQASQAAPPSSPRLPSPPPLPELQLGPRSPSVNAAPGELRLDNVVVQDDGAARRVRPGTSAAEMVRGPPFVPLHQVESPFQLQEYLKSSYCKVTRDDNSDTVVPITKDSAMQLATPPIQQDTGEPVDRNLWLYELCRFLVQRTNRLIVSFFADNPPCSSQTCAEMRASEWQYLCAVHEPPKSCCAIDYCCHTLDWAANVLTSTKHFPSRLSLGGEGASAYQSMRQLTNIFRRVYRIYAHAWFQHREAFWMLEQEEGLYKFFRTVCDAYTLIPEDNYTIPAEAEGDREDMIDTPLGTGRNDDSIPRSDTAVNLAQQQQPQQAPAERELPDPAPPATPSSGLPTTTTRRHRHTPSTGTQVTMIAEGLEEEEEDAANRTIHISQSVPSEPTATSTTQTAAPPSKTHPRSPRPEMLIPIEATQAESLKSLEDPTPKPESHLLDPFSEASDTKATSIQPLTEPDTNYNSTEPPTPLTAVDKSQLLPYPPLTPKTPIPMPALDTQSTPSAFNEDEEVISPGGGSIRTVSEDILSGILAHTDVDSDGNEVVPKDTSKNADAAQSEKNNLPAEEEHKSEPEPEIKKAKGEDEKEMGEIKLEKTTTAIKDDAESDSTDEQPIVEDERIAEPDAQTKEEKEESNADGTKTEETPSGLI